MTIFLKNLDLSTIKPKTRRKKRVNRTLPISFPIKLFQMLEEVQQEGRQSIVGWNPDGKTFQVHQHERFVREVLPKYFKQSKYKSFQRQLNFYQFQRIMSGPLEGSYGHPCFVRGNPELCNRIKRSPCQQPNQQLPSSTLVERHERSVVEQALAKDYPTNTLDIPLEVADVSLESSVDLGRMLELLRNDIRNNNFINNATAPSFLTDFPSGSRPEAKDLRLSFVGKTFFAIPVEFTGI
ncbi:HSF-type DNA-binding protein [Nitzschia inconspicua]|uniref:HSF-type DNA-binding protein n=1 Tax=Nitzschia inconspicua TaxID=303405 RepID=A0A9K3LFV4_9STRA|nr:HSF-type DNA-binding protein [Nitzschia inconspicua]